jgi:hypothetical protein
MQPVKQLLKRVLVLLPTANGARHLLGVCYLRQQDWTNALKTYRRLVTEHPQEPFYLKCRVKTPDLSPPSRGLGSLRAPAVGNPTSIETAKHD